MTLEQDTRRAKRDSVFRVATITIPDSNTALTSRVRNVSSGGARIDVVDGLQSGMQVEIAIGGQPAVAATIAWVADGQCGVVFDGAVSPADDVYRADPTPTAGWMAELRDGYRR